MSFKVVIPSRFASSRLPGKPLADLAGKSMIERVYARAKQSAADEVVVATDDQRIADAVAAFGGEVEMTASHHPSGTDRIAEVAARRAWSAHTLVVNVQGDEPLIPPAVINQVAELLNAWPSAAAATLSEDITEKSDVFTTSAVKVTTSDAGRALYFSRAPIPWDRNSFDSSDTHGTLPAIGNWQRHIGIYAYRVATLNRFVELPAGRLELTESLEQLRLLAADMDIYVARAELDVPAGIDTQDDLDRVRALLGAG